MEARAKELHSVLSSNLLPLTECIALQDKDSLVNVSCILTALNTLEAMSKNELSKAPTNPR